MDFTCGYGIAISTKRMQTVFDQKARRERTIKIRENAYANQAVKPQQIDPKFKYMCTGLKLLNIMNVAQIQILLTIDRHVSKKYPHIRNESRNSNTRKRIGNSECSLFLAQSNFGFLTWKFFTYFRIEF